MHFTVEYLLARAVAGLVGGWVGGWASELVPRGINGRVPGIGGGGRARTDSTVHLGFEF